MEKRRLLVLPIVFCLSWWLALAVLIIWVNPELIKNLPIEGSYGPFWLLLVGATWFTGALVWGNYRRASLTALVIVTFLVLRLINLGYWLNGLLLVGLAVVIDSIFTKATARDT